jgi:L-lysine 6-transaminase
MVRVVQEFRIVDDERLLSQVELKAKALNRGLCTLEHRYPKLVFNVRGLGLYQGFSLRNPEQLTTLVCRALEQERLLLLAAGERSIRLRPPLDVTLSDIADFLRRLERTLDALSSEPS